MSTFPPPFEAATHHGDDHVGWAPQFLCDSIRGPIILSDGRVTTCTLDHEGQNAIGSIHEHDFPTIVERYARTRMSAMADPSSKPMCYRCYHRLPRWKNQQVPRSEWIRKECSDANKERFLSLFDPRNLRLNLELSSHCNLRCIGCSVARPEFKHSRQAPNLDLAALRRWLAGGHTRDIAHVRLYHMGETWLHPEWDAICSFLKKENTAITLFTSTNGMPLRAGDTLARVIASPIDHVMFSIHGAFQASVERYMGSSFKLDVALEMARQLRAGRAAAGSKLYLSWKYLLFSWNDSEEEIAEARRLCDEAGFDEINFSITSQPSPSRRFAPGTPAWTALRDECAGLWPRSATYHRSAPMTVLYPGLHQRSHRAALPPSVVVHPAPAPVLQSASPAVAPAPESSLPSRLRSLARKVAQRCGLPPPTAPLAHHLARAQSHLDSGNPARALRHFDAALAFGPGTEFQHLGRARALRGVGDWAAAVEAYETAIQRRIQGPARFYGEDIYLELATALERVGRKDGARNAYRFWQETSYLRHGASPRSIYCPIPKNACTYLKTAFVQNSRKAETFRAAGGDAHRFLRDPRNQLLLHNRDLLANPAYFRFVVLRNPLDRLASAYANLFIRPLRWHAVPDPSMHAATLAIQRSQRRRARVVDTTTFAELVDYVDRTPDFDLDYHLRPQTAFFERLEDFDFVGRVEEMELVTQTLTERIGWSFAGVGTFNQTHYAGGARTGGLCHVSARELQRRQIFPRAEALFSDELRAIVERRFAADFAAWERANVAVAA